MTYDFEKEKELQRERQRERDIERRHRDKMNADARRERAATERADKAERVQSMRREGYSESEIRSLERKRSARGCVGQMLGLGLVAALVVGGLAWAGMSDEPSEGIADVDEALVVPGGDESFADYNDNDWQESDIIGPLQVEQESFSAVPEIEDPIQADETEPEIIFESRPIVQEIPGPSISSRNDIAEDAIADAEANMR